MRTRPLDYSWVPHHHANSYIHHSSWYRNNYFLESYDDAGDHGTPPHYLFRTEMALFRSPELMKIVYGLGGCSSPHYPVSPCQLRSRPVEAPGAEMSGIKMKREGIIEGVLKLTGPEVALYNSASSLRDNGGLCICFILSINTTLIL